MKSLQEKFKEKKKQKTKTQGRKKKKTQNYHSTFFFFFRWFDFSVSEMFCFSFSFSICKGRAEKQGRDGLQVFILEDNPSKDKKISSSREVFSFILEKHSFKGVCAWEDTVCWAWSWKVECAWRTQKLASHCSKIHLVVWPVANSVICMFPDSDSWHRGANWKHQSKAEEERKNYYQILVKCWKTCSKV